MSHSLLSTEVHFAMMGKKFGIRKLVRGSSSKSRKVVTKAVSRSDEEQERWHAFESKLAERMGAKSTEPTLLNDTSGTTPMDTVEEQSEEHTSRDLVSPTNVVARTASLRPPVSPMSPNRTTSLIDQSSPKQTLMTMDYHPPTSPQSIKTSRRRTDSSNSEASFSSGVVKVVPTVPSTSKSTDTETSKATLKTKANNGTLKKKMFVINKSKMPSSQKYNWRTNSIHSYQGSTDSSTGYSTDSFTYATRDTYGTKDTFYTYNTLNDPNISGLEKMVLRLATMFVCEGNACRSSKHM